MTNRLIKGLYEYCIMRWFSSPEDFMLWYFNEKSGSIRLKDGTWAVHQSNEFHNYCYDEAYRAWKKPQTIKKEYNPLDDFYSEKEVAELLSTQRVNSYVAILSKTRDNELAKVAGNAPEPSGGKWRKLTIHNKSVRDIKKA